MEIEPHHNPLVRSEMTVIFVQTESSFTRLDHSVVGYALVQRAAHKKSIEQFWNVYYHLAQFGASLLFINVYTTWTVALWLFEGAIHFVTIFITVFWKLIHFLINFCIYEDDFLQ